MSKAQRDKGKRIERLIARELSALWPKIARCGGQAGGPGRPDLDYAPVWCECKGGKRPSILDALSQARMDRDASVCYLPIMAATHRDHEETLITMPVGDFVELVRCERLWAVEKAMGKGGSNNE